MSYIRTFPLCQPTSIPPGPVDVALNSKLLEIMDITPTWLHISTDKPCELLVQKIQLGCFLSHDRLLVPSSLFGSPSVLSDSSGNSIDVGRIGLRLFNRPGIADERFKLSLLNTSDKSIVFYAEIMGYRKDEMPNLDLLHVAGLGRTSIEAGQAANINIRCPHTFAPCVLHVPPNVLEKIRVERIFSGVPSQETEAILPEDLPPFHHFKLSPYRVLTVNSWLTLQVRNNSDKSQVFTGAVLGYPAIQKTHIPEQPTP